MIPKSIKRNGDIELVINWDDGHNGRHVLSSLRKYCPCASCKTDIEAHEGSVLLPILTPGQNILNTVDVVGNYALQLGWADGHRTGIYTFVYLRQICECDECRHTASE